MTTLHRIATLSGVAFAATATPALAQQQVPTDTIKAEMLPMIEFIMAQCAEFGWGLIALGFAAILLISFFAAWAVSKLLTPDTGTLINALRYYLLGLLTNVILLGLTFGVAWYGFTSGSFGLAFGVVILACIAGLIINFVIPMKVYDIGFFRAFFFNILVGITAGIGQAVLGAVVPGPLDNLQSKSPEEQRKMISEWRLKKREGELNTRLDQQFRQPLAETAALTPAERIQQMHDQLQIERAKLDLNDQPAVIAFNQRVAEYNAFKAQYAAALAATPPPAAP